MPCCEDLSEKSRVVDVLNLIAVNIGCGGCSSCNVGERDATALDLPVQTGLHYSRKCERKSPGFCIFSSIVASFC